MGRCPRARRLGTPCVGGTRNRMDRMPPRRDAPLLAAGRNGRDPAPRDAQRHEDQQHPLRPPGTGALRDRSGHGAAQPLLQRLRRRDPHLRQPRPRRRRKPRRRMARHGHVPRLRRGLPLGGARLPHAGRNRRTRLLGTLHHLRTGAALPDGLSRRRHLLQDQVARPQPRPYAGAVRTAPQRRGALRRDAGARRRTGRTALPTGTDKNGDDPDEFTPAQIAAPG